MSYFLTNRDCALQVCVALMYFYINNDPALFRSELLEEIAERGSHFRQVYRYFRVRPVKMQVNSVFSIHKSTLPSVLRVKTSKSIDFYVLSIISL